MKAIQITATGGPEVMRLVDLPMPVPGPGEVLLKTHAIGVAYAEVMLRKGSYPWMPPLPFVPGNEITAHVADANGSRRLSTGQPVYLTGWDIGFSGGLYAEYVVVKDSAPWPLPPTVDLDATAGLMNYIVAILMMDCGARGAEHGSVLVHGVTGGVGTALADLAQQAGTLVIGTAGSDEKCAFARARGVAHVINYRSENVPERVLALTGGRGVDVIYNLMAGNSFVDDLKMVAPLGLIVAYAVLSGMPDQDLFRSMLAAVSRSPAVRLIGTHAFDKMPEFRLAAFEKAIALLVAGRIAPVIGTRLPLADAARAHGMLEARESLGKILLKP